MLAPAWKQRALAAGLAGLVTLGAHGCSKTCTLIGCDDGIFVRAVVHRSIDELGMATIASCYNTSCKSERLLVPVDRSKPSPLYDAGEGWTSIALTVHSPDIPRNDGDVVRVALVTADGKSLLDVTRALTIHARPNPNGEGCGDECRFAQAVLYENTPSGLKCENGTVETSVKVDLLLGKIKGYDERNAKLTVCRNKVCATSAKTLGWRENTLEGDLRASLDRSSTSLTAAMSPLPAQLSDDDRYSVTLVDTALRKVLYTKELPADYETTYPNGKECDVYPSRQATIQFE